jgi:hypothetical protein
MRTSYRHSTSRLAKHDSAITIYHTTPRARCATWPTNALHSKEQGRRGSLPKTVRSASQMPTTPQNVSEPAIPHTGSNRPNRQLSKSKGDKGLVKITYKRCLGGYVPIARTLDLRSSYLTENTFFGASASYTTRTSKQTQSDHLTNQTTSI